MRYILFVIGLLLAIDGLYCGHIGSMGAGEMMIVADGIIFILWGSFYDAFRTKKPLRIFKGFFVVCMSVLVVYSVAVCLIGSQDNETGREDYVIVLGYELKDDEPTQLLKNRLDKSLDYLKRNVNSTVIVSGRRSGENSISEARAMANYLISHGIDEERIIIDQASYNTHDNFINNIGTVRDGKVVFVTSDYHVIRAAQMAQQCGLISPAHISAPTPIPELPARCARELLAEIYSIRYYIG